MSKRDDDFRDFGRSLIKSETEFVNAYIKQSGRKYEEVLADMAAVHINALAVSISLGIITAEDVVEQLAVSCANLLLMKLGGTPTGAAPSPDAPPTVLSMEDEAIARELEELAKLTGGSEAS